MNAAPRIAISGLHRGENPQPGAGIIRSIRRSFAEAFIVGLAYDAFESGIYVEGGPDAVYAMPYPTSGPEAYFERLDAVLEKTPFDFFIPTLDAEMEFRTPMQPGERRILRGEETRWIVGEDDGVHASLVLSRG